MTKNLTTYSDLETKKQVSINDSQPQTRSDLFNQLKEPMEERKKAQISIDFMNGEVSVKTEHENKNK